MQNILGDMLHHSVESTFSWYSDYPLRVELPKEVGSHRSVILAVDTDDPVIIIRDTILKSISQ